MPGAPYRSMVRLWLKSRVVECTSDDLYILCVACWYHAEETIRLLLSVIFKLTTKKLTRGYCFTPNMLPNQIAALSFILLILMYWSSEFLFMMSLDVKSCVHQESLSQLGQITLTEDEIKQCVKFVFSLYPTTKKTPSSLDELRYLLFCQKRQKWGPCTHIGQLHPAFKKSQLSSTSLEEITCWQSRPSRTSVLWLERGRWRIVPNFNDEQSRTREYNWAHYLQLQELIIVPKYLFMC